MNDVSVYLGRQKGGGGGGGGGGGVPNRKSELEVLACSFCPGVSNFHEAKKVSLQVQK